MIKVQLRSHVGWVTVAMFTSRVAAERDRENREKFAMLPLPSRVMNT
jgi:hypothetical protein